MNHQPERNCLPLPEQWSFSVLTLLIREVVGMFAYPFHSSGRDVCSPNVVFFAYLTHSSGLVFAYPHHSSGRDVCSRCRWHQQLLHGRRIRSNCRKKINPRYGRSSALPSSASPPSASRKAFVSISPICKQKGLHQHFPHLQTKRPSSASSPSASKKEEVVCTVTNFSMIFLKYHQR